MRACCWENVSPSHKQSRNNISASAVAIETTIQMDDYQASWSIKLHRSCVEVLDVCTIAYQGHRSTSYHWHARHIQQRGATKPFHASHVYDGRLSWRAPLIQTQKTRQSFQSLGEVQKPSRATGGRLDTFLKDFPMEEKRRSPAPFLVHVPRHWCHTLCEFLFHSILGLLVRWKVTIFPCDHESDY